MRRAVAADCDAVWRINGDASARAHSLSSAPIPWEDHVRWFSVQLGRADLLFLVAEDEARTVVANIRFARVWEHAEVSIAVTPQERGRGAGSWLIAQASPLALSELQVKYVSATIRSTNQGSQRAFLNAGYVRVGSETSEGTSVERFAWPRLP